MNVAGILADKGADVVTAPADETLQNISNTMAAHKIGAVIIKDQDQKVCGIASERDVVRQISQLGVDALSKPVLVCMTKNVITCQPDSTIDQVMAIMTENKFRHLPVMDGESLIGIVSIGDVVKRKIEQAERETEDLKQYIAG